MDMNSMTARTEQLVDALTGAMMSTMEVAAERMQLASQVAAVQQRMGAFAAVLESISVQRLALEERQAAAAGPMKALLARQIELLTLQETALLERCGAAPEVARKAVAAKPRHAPDGRFMPAV